MGERKVLNKYIPPDFDPSLVPRGKKLSSKDGTVPVRMMLPFSIQCSTCHTFLYRGTKFNSKKEAMGGPDGTYLGITRWRFYIKCTSCARPITFLTDPKIADYEMESGGTRNYEIQRDKAKTEEEAAADKEQAEKEDPMKALENRVVDSQREMADHDNLEEIKAMNARHLKMIAAGEEIDVAALLYSREEPQTGVELTEEEEALVKSIKFGNQQAIRRLDDKDEDRIVQERQERVAQLEKQQLQQQEKVAAKKPAMPVIKVKRKRSDVPADDAKKSKAEPSGLMGLLGGYGSDSDSD